MNTCPTLLVSLLYWMSSLFAPHSSPIGDMSDTPGWQPQTPPPPIVVAESPNHIECGRIAIGGVAQRLITLKNVTSGSASLAVISKSCACVNTILKKTTLDAGASTDLDISVVVAGGYGVQSHTLRLEVTGQRDQPNTTTQSRQFIDFAISFVPDRRYEVVPRWLVIRSIVGESKMGTISIISPPGSDLRVFDVTSGSPALRLHDPRPCAANPTVQMINFAASPTEPGSKHFNLTFGTNSESLPSTSIDVTIVAMTPWRCQPGGLVATYSSQQTPPAVRATLSPRIPGEAAPASVTLKPDVPGVTVSLIDQNQLTLTIDPLRVPNPTGSTTARVVSATGALCAEIPVVWYAHSKAP